jgi:hypothetical protein
MVQVRTKYVLNWFWAYQYLLLCHNTPSFWRIVHRGFTYSSFTFILESHSIIVWLSKISYIYIPLFLYYCHPLIIFIR